MAHRIRTSEIAIFAAFVLYCMAWLPLHFVADTPSAWLPAAQAHPELALALGALNLAGVLALLAIVIGGLPLLFAALRWAVTSHRWDVLSLLIASLLVAMVVIGASVVALVTGGVRQTGGLNTPTPLGVTLRFGLGLGGLLLLIVSAVVVAIAIRRSELSLPMARFALISAGLATIAMVVGTLAGVALIALVNSEAQQLGAPLPLEGVVTLLLLAAAALATVALWRGVRAARGGGDAAGGQAISG